MIAGHHPLFNHASRGQRAGMFRFSLRRRAAHDYLSHPLATPVAYPTAARVMKHFHLQVEYSTFNVKNAIFGHLEV